MKQEDEVTRILRGGPEHAQERLLPLVYDELKGIAERRMSRERSGHTLQATALVHEAFMRLSGDVDMDWQDRRHFYGAAAEAMRRVLIDHARKRGSDKRGGRNERVDIELNELGSLGENEEALVLFDSLEQLAEEDPRAATVARLRFLSGLSVRETAQALGVSERTVNREWTFARARLFELVGSANGQGEAERN